jgi:hypothetical protein
LRGARRRSNPLFVIAALDPAIHRNKTAGRKVRCLILSRQENVVSAQDGDGQIKPGRDNIIGLAVLVLAIGVSKKQTIERP